VHLVRRKGTKEVYALKQLDKDHHRQKNAQRVYAERDALSEARGRWCVDLIATFQDGFYVYMVQEFIQGGDLISHIKRKKRLTESETAFYMAELLEALDTVHQCGFIHRDVKPDNIVITMSGHIMLLDFGLCMALDPMASNPDATQTIDSTGSGARKKQECCGTPQYMAPEGFDGEYGLESDLWAVGIIAFECLVGTVPFHSGLISGEAGLNQIKKKISNHTAYFPGRLKKTRALGMTSPSSEHFLNGLVCGRSTRLTTAQARSEPFFEIFRAGIVWAELHLSTPPWVPEVSSPEDSSLFEFGQDKTSVDNAVNKQVKKDAKIRCDEDATKEVEKEVEEEDTQEVKPDGILPRPAGRLQWDQDLEWINYAADTQELRIKSRDHELHRADSRDLQPTSQRSIESELHAAGAEELRQKSDRSRNGEPHAAGAGELRSEPHRSNDGEPHAAGAKELRPKSQMSGDGVTRSADAQEVQPMSQTSSNVELHLAGTDELRSKSQRSGGGESSAAGAKQVRPKSQRSRDGELHRAGAQELRPEPQRSSGVEPVYTV